MLYQGVTSIIGGNSGTSLAPIYSEDMMRSMRKWTDVGGININWHTMKEFLSVIEKHRLSVNFGSFVGYGTLRRGITGDQSRTITAPEAKSLQKHIKNSFKEGALGVSTGMIYSHEKDISTEELLTVVQVSAKHDKLFAAHLRNESDEVIASVREIIDIYHKTHARIHIPHLKVMIKKNWSYMSAAVDMLEDTPISFDIYPYTTSSMVLYVFLPEWVSQGGRRMMLERLRNGKLRAQVEEELNAGPDLSRAIVAETLRSHYFCGKTFGEIGKKNNKSIGEVIIDVLLASDGQVMIFFDSISEENIERGLRSKNACISSNGVGYSIMKRNENIEHPRSFGAFPRAYGMYVHDKHQLRVEEMVYKSTGKVAEALNISKRGMIKTGCHADIVIFDRETFRDRAHAWQAYQYASGVHWLLVNGQVAIKYGKYTGVRAGTIIRN
jgi:N-acyl-D-amino-acid deacylase